MFFFKQRLQIVQHSHNKLYEGDQVKNGFKEVEETIRYDMMITFCFSFECGHCVRTRAITLGMSMVTSGNLCIQTEQSSACGVIYT